ncbi:putative Lipopolysaccharide biosynthesis protein [Candidatus Nitrospira nitrosa]|uniref:non-specific protein-tyrosine kinase n=1 Tax=Candidatus Nitrospira nitrosa TaxID=1742972 RepID=A0A0S4LIU5_9BACT|nr:AAA family ATPase [Candidatus Nitrospira nitrosa]CUS36589.1 putative Lipopolysaccharide biosynthesis protein [Candidatus Nitrospira nitrosa]
MTTSDIELSPLYDPPSDPLPVLIQGYWRNIIRRKWVVLGSLVAGVGIAAFLCVALPKSYRSSTLILIENQKIPEDYVKGIGGANIEQRLTTIQQQVLSRTFLSRILEEYKPYEAQIRREGIESAIETLRRMIKVETVGTPSTWGKSVEAISISFAHEDPMTAMKVTEKLAALFVEENSRVREQLVTSVSSFLEQELQDAQRLLEVKERAISEFKTRYVTELPEQKEANLRTLDRLQTELNTTTETIHSLTARQSLFEKTLTQYEQYEMKDRASSPLMPSVRSQSVQDPLIVRLSELQKQLATLMAMYKDTYPDVAALKEEIAELQSRIAENRHFVQSKESPLDRHVEVGRVVDSSAQKLASQMDEVRLDITNLKAKEARIKRDMRELENRVERTPSHEQQLMILVRDYDNMQKNYQALLDKRLNARVAENLEKRQQGEQIRVMDPANLPQKAEKPNRLAIMIFGFIGGGGLGIALALGIDQLNPTFKRREEVELLPGIQVLASIPEFLTVSPQIKIPSQIGLPATKDSPHALATSKPNGSRHALTSENLSLVTKWQPRSIAAEQYRMAATKLALSSEGRHSTVVEIASALMGEGKTTTVVNLGYTMARDLGKRTLLIDCDFQRPALHHYARIPARAGLTELLDGQTSLENCLSVIDESACSILAAGGLTGEYNELWRIQQLKSILPTLREQFQYIFLNTPPVLSSASVGILASLADEIVWVIRAGSTPRNLVRKAFTMLSLATRQQVILNRVDAQSMAHHIYGYAMPYASERLIEKVK